MMGPLEELKLHIDALALAVDANPKFFASIKHYVTQFQQLLIGPKAPTVAELQILTAKIEEFWSRWRPSGGEGFYIPPRETADTDSTVQQLNVLVHDLATLQETEFQNLATHFVDRVQSGDRSQHDTIGQPCVFIGHGRSRLWARVKTYLDDELGLATVTYESESRTGDSIVQILENMLDQATFAILLLTAEDEGPSSERRARQNVVHEAGLFQGRLGFKRAVLLVQEGIEEFSNVAGLQHIPFSGENVEQTFYELRRVLKRERQLEK
jgi:predicted nucleotide-binding protein